MMGHRGWILEVLVVAVVVFGGAWAQDSSCVLTLPQSGETEFVNCPELTDGFKLYYSVDGDSISMAFQAELLSDDGGYVALGFPATSGSMVGTASTTTVAVIAYASSSAPLGPSVGDYALYAKDSSRVTIEDLQSLENVEVGFENGLITASFTRKLRIDGLAPIVLDKEMGLLWARGAPPLDSDALQYHGAERGAPSVMFSSTTGGTVTEGSTYAPIFVAHGAMMIVAICFLMPSGVILLRVLNNKAADAWWFQVHRAVMTLAALILVVSFIMAVSRGSHEIARHLGIGSVVFALLIIQVLASSFLRPGVDSKHRLKFCIAHRVNAGILRGLGASNVFIGISILAQNTVTWYVIAGVLLGVMVVLEIFTSVFLFRKFDPRPDRVQKLPTQVPPAGVTNIERA